MDHRADGTASRAEPSDAPRPAETQTKPEAAVAFYRKELVQRGWKEDKSEAKVYPGGSTSLVFEQNAVIVTLRIDRDSVRIQSQLLGEPIPRSASKK